MSDLLQSSTFKPISENQANALERLAANRDYQAERDAWIDYPALAECIVYRKPEVVMHGKTYNVKHYYFKQSCFIQLKDSLTPCGWFNYDKAKEYAQG